MLTAQRDRLEENTFAAASTASQLNSQLAEALTKVVKLEGDKADSERHINKLEDQVFTLQV